MNQLQQDSSGELAQIIIDGIQDKKARDVVKLDLTKIPNAISDYFIICHGTSVTQVEAIANAAIDSVRKRTGEKPWHKEGFENAEWILIDYVNVVLHVFIKDLRKFYQLEELWADADITNYENED